MEEKLAIINPSGNINVSSQYWICLIWSLGKLTDGNQPLNVLGEEWWTASLLSIPCFRVAVTGLTSWSHASGQLHPASSQLLAKEYPRETVSMLPFISSCLTFGNNSVPPSVDAQEPAYEKGCVCLMGPWPDLGLHSETKQICSWIKGKLIMDTEKSVVLGWTRGV